jgi:TolB-like protein/tetratricopeptide (TPR) repeat protein
MPPERSSDVEFEIGHVLFIDLVGYSKRLIDEQRELLNKLNSIVLKTEAVRTAEAAGKLTRIPTGDGMALVFRTSPEAPARCALEITKMLREESELQLRMGIHSGPVSDVTDVNERANVAGAGINMAQRVMDLGDAGHILLSRHVAEDLEHYARWQPYLHDLGLMELKHGVRLGIVNLYKGEVGNPKMPEKFKQAAGAGKAAAAISGPIERPTARKWAMIGAALLIVAAVTLGLLILRPKSSPTAATVIADKSIAVLPFENLSGDPNNAYFTEGIQEEILTRLSKIADLKVISRTSTAHYASAPVDLRQIASQLDVANILEGSVQKAGDRVRINVQLINALNDAHLWADIYDRKLTDIFAVESDIAKTIVDTLQAKLTGSERRAIAAQPTSDMTAYQLYLKGRSLWGKRGGDNIRQAIAFYEQAITSDPNYALTYAGLAEAYISLPSFTSVAPWEALLKAKTAALKALQLDDKLAEAHNALAMVLYNRDLDIAGSISEFQRAITLNPNYATAHQWYAFPLNALGRFDEAIAECKRAIELDPLSPIINLNLGQTLVWARRYDDAIAQLRKTLEIDPTFYVGHFYLGVALQLKGDVPAAIAEYTKAQQLTGDPDPGIPVLLAIAKAQSGDKEAAVQMLAELEELSRHRYVREYWSALLYLSLGNRDEAIRRLERGADHADSFIALIKVDPLLDPLRRDPRFEALAQKIVPRGAK